MEAHHKPFLSSSSRDSSPRSREIDHPDSSSSLLSLDDPSCAASKPKLLCSYGGRIQPRPHDQQLFYAGGDTKLFSVDRHVRFPSLLSKLSSLCGVSSFCLKYQLPGEDLDALVSVVDDDDLEHMMVEYDRLCHASSKPARLRLFLFSRSPSRDLSSDSNDAIVSAQAANPDYLFGFDKGCAAAPLITLQNSVHVPLPALADCGLSERRAAADPVTSPTEIKQQFKGMDGEQLPLAQQQQTALNNMNGDEANNGLCAADYSPVSAAAPEKVTAASQAVMQVNVPAATAASYAPERLVTSGGLTVAANGNQPAYYIAAPGGGSYYAAAVRPATGPIGQAYYGLQRVGPGVYREPGVYNIVQPTQVAVAEPGFPQVVYYATAGGLVPTYQTATTAAAAMGVDHGRQGGGGALGPDAKVVGKTLQSTAG